MARAPRDPFRLVFNRAELDRLLNSESGPVARDLAVKAARATNSARRRAPKKTGALRRSIGWEIGRDEQGLYADVVAREYYARFVEKGHRKEGGGRVSPRRFLRPALFAAVRGRGKPPG